jgi:hypothetical protein
MGSGGVAGVAVSVPRDGAVRPAGWEWGVGKGTGRGSADDEGRDAACD